ncbi:MAG: tRNA (guanosine(46)-N7)-methyltransferase TrmB [Bacteroidales bacterium]
MTKRKLQRFAEMETFDHVIQPAFEEVFDKDFRLKGAWNKTFFKHSQPLVLELGCGKGEYTVGLAKRFPNKNFLGIDIKGSRMWRGAKTIEEEHLSNAGFLRTRIDFVASLFAPKEVDEIWITFPDPQPKKSLKRLTSTRFLERYVRFLKPGGLIHLKTDNQDLHLYTKALVKKNKFQVLEAYQDLYASDYAEEFLEIKTFYERQFLEEGKPITYLRFVPEHRETFEEPDGEGEHFFSTSL